MSEIATAQTPNRCFLEGHKDTQLAQLTMTTVPTNANVKDGVTLIATVQVPPEQYTKKHLSLKKKLS